MKCFQSHILASKEKKLLQLEILILHNVFQWIYNKSKCIAKKWNINYVCYLFKKFKGLSLHKFEKLWRFKVINENNKNGNKLRVVVVHGIDPEVVWIDDQLSWIKTVDFGWSYVGECEEEDQGHIWGETEKN